MNTAIQEKMLSNLHISRERLLDEITVLLIKQQNTDYRMETEFYEKKYGRAFKDFDTDFHQQTITFDQEDDWLAWKFASESQIYWPDLLSQTKT